MKSVIFNINLVVLFLMVFSCSKKFTLLEENPECKTSLEGFYHCAQYYIGKAPAVVLNDNGRPDLEYGTVLETNEEGILFLHQKTIHDTLTKKVFYPIEQIMAIIDEKNKIVFGELPSKYTKSVKTLIYLHTINAGRQEFFLELNPNQYFRYCLPPGFYRVTQIKFINHLNQVLVAYDFGRFSFTIEKDNANYLADLYLEIDCKSTRTYQIPFKVAPRQSDLLAPVIVGGVIGGALGAAALGVAYGVAQRNEASQSVYTLSIDDNENFQKQCTSPMSKVVIRHFKQ